MAALSKRPISLDPIFLVGPERSGTTVFRLMLDHHSQIAFHMEFEFAVDMISDAGVFPDVDTYCDRLKTSRPFLASYFSADTSLAYPDLINSFLIQKRERDGKRFVGATVHYHFDRLLYIWPHARFIHLLRDGRDVARSRIGMGWAGNVWTASKWWVNAELTWDRVCNLVASERRMEVRYEDLVLDPVENLERVCRFIGVPYEREMLDYPLTTTYSPPDPALVFQWREKLSDKEKRLVEQRIGDLLASRGYELSGLLPIRVSEILKLWLLAQDKLARMRFRIARYGFPMVMASFLCRRLGIARFQTSIQRRMDAIDQRLTR